MKNLPPPPVRKERKIQGAARATQEKSTNRFCDAVFFRRLRQLYSDPSPSGNCRHKVFNQLLHAREQPPAPAVNSGHLKLTER